MTMLNDFLSTSATWGVLLTLAAFALGTLINHKTGKAVFNPLLLGTVFVIVFLSVCGIPYASYKASASPVSYLLLPATVSLAVPLYEKWDLLRKNVLAIVMGNFGGTLPAWAVCWCCPCCLGWTTASTSPCCRSRSPQPSAWMSARSWAASQP